MLKHKQLASQKPLCDISVLITGNSKGFTRQVSWGKVALHTLDLLHRQCIRSLKGVAIKDLGPPGWWSFSCTLHSGSNKSIIMQNKTCKWHRCYGGEFLQVLSRCFQDREVREFLFKGILKKIHSKLVEDRRKVHARHRDRMCKVLMVRGSIWGRPVEASWCSGAQKRMGSRFQQVQDGTREVGRSHIL